MLLLVHVIEAAAAWYAAPLGVPLEHENPRCAFVRAPGGVIIGFHAADARNPGDPHPAAQSRSTRTGLHGLGECLVATDCAV